MVPYSLHKWYSRFDFHFDLRRNRDWIELDSEIAKNIRKFAKEKNMPTRRLVNEWLKERLRNLQQWSSRKGRP